MHFLLCCPTSLVNARAVELQLAVSSYRHPRLQGAMKNIRIKVISISLFLSWSISTTAEHLTNCVVDPDAEPDLTYSSGWYVLDNKEHWPYPYGSFSILVDKKGIGHVQTYAVPLSNNKRTDDRIFLDWKARTSFIKFSQTGARNWTQLNLKDAIMLWGEPRKNLNFYTFDANNTWNGEPNIYHLDFKFNNNGIISAYRVRGIGIAHAQWVTPDWKP